MLHGIILIAFMKEFVTAFDTDELFFEVCVTEFNLYLKFSEKLTFHKVKLSPFKRGTFLSLSKVFSTDHSSVGLILILFRMVKHFPSIY